MYIFSTISFAAPTPAEAEMPKPDVDNEPTLCNRICNAIKTAISWIVYIFSFGCCRVFEAEMAEETEETEENPKVISLEERLKGAIKNSGLTQDLHPMQLTAYLLLAEMVDDMCLPGECVIFTGGKDVETGKCDITMVIPPSMRGDMQDLLQTVLEGSIKFFFEEVGLPFEVGVASDLDSHKICTLFNLNPEDEIRLETFPFPFGNRIYKDFSDFSLYHPEHGLLDSYLRSCSSDEFPSRSTLQLSH